VIVVCNELYHSSIISFASYSLYFFFFFFPGVPHHIHFTMDKIKRTTGFTQ
jgi:hypothetical protein